MSQFKLLEEIVKKLTEKNIPYMLTGSLVSSLQGIPRSTHDIDIIISIKNIDTDKLIEAFPKKNYYLDKKAIEEAISRKSLFNVLSLDEGDKIDFWILTSSEYDKSRFLRKQKIKFNNFEIFVSTPEDTILEKLYWSKLSGGSKKHFNDAVNVFEIQYGSLDMDYIGFWAQKLNIESLFEELKIEANTLE